MRVQREVAEAIGAVPPAGFKIGATARQMQSYLGIVTPAAGFIAATALLTTPAEHRFADLLAPGCEPEVALRLGRDIPPGKSAAPRRRIASPRSSPASRSSRTATPISARSARRR